MQGKALSRWQGDLAECIRGSKDAVGRGRDGAVTPPVFWVSLHFLYFRSQALSFCWYLLIQVARKKKKEKSTISENLGTWEKYPFCCCSCAALPLWRQQQSCLVLHMTRERCDRGKEYGHHLGDISPMYHLGVRMPVQVPRKKNNLITPALAASTTNLPIILAGGI